ncbi:EI24 domain-containing protein [Gulosibacter chungangensis]|uniref:EI24 domain-containing protein n=1 Tax=Gulosibacter chungangensis TaxID=979746 RepID=A0A7J5BBI0_9MICO|nr:EI24 domain-containing protein [Gulosibacter chungangensis]KAB1641922.1 hypothetical protein F8O05_11410 [Gulosibacter chungangensis]
MREFWLGVRSLIAGFGWWRVNPAVMAAGLVPALIVAVLLGVGLGFLAFALDDIVSWATPWTDGWAAWLAVVVQIAIGVGIFAGALVIAIFTFTALTLMVGEPFYDRIWQSVEQSRAGRVPDSNYSLWGAIGDSIVLILKGIGIAILAAVCGLIPLIGGFVGATLGVLLSGWVLADEHTSRALTARGIEPRDRAELLRQNRGRVLGFGAATSALFLVPLGAIITMPAAVAGSTQLVQDLLGETVDHR